MSETAQLVTAVFQAWKRAGIEFLVLRNYQQLPDAVENDIDVLLRPKMRARAEQLLVATAATQGFQLHNRAEFATLALYLFHPASNAQVHFDLFSELLWRGFHFLEGAPLLDLRINRALFDIPHPAHEAATNLLASMIYTGVVKEKYKDSIAANFSTAPREAQQLLSATYGERLAAFLVDAGRQKRWSSIEARVGRLRRRLVLSQVALRGGPTMRQLAAISRRVFQRLWCPPGMLLVLCGPDGSGKSTAAQLLSSRLKTTFSPEKSQYFHWKPRLWKQSKEGQASPAPHGRPRRGMLASWLYFTLHWLEFVLTAMIRIRPVTFRGGLVVIDRYYDDFFVDQSRYRLSVPQWLVRFGYRFIQKADLAFVLDAPTELLQQRKAEVPPLETERQRQAYRRLATCLLNARLIDASQAPMQVAKEMESAVLQWLAARNKARHGQLADALPETGTAGESVQRAEQMHPPCS